LSGAIAGKKAVGRPGLQYLKQAAGNTGADSYTAMKAAGYLHLEGNSLKLHRKQETAVRTSCLACVSLALVNGPPIRGPPVCIMLLAATFVNYVYTIKLHDILSGDVYHLMRFFVLWPRTGPQ
jgi:hypothetical protein